MKNLFLLISCFLVTIGAPCLAEVQGENNPDLLTTAPDLENPAISAGDPTPGKRVLQSLPDYAGTEVAHALYLPTDWARDKHFPVIVEYLGNNHQVKDGGGLGYGISGGKGFIWVVLPYVGSDHKTDMNWWWGDVDATVAYAKKAVPVICQQWGGDSAQVVLVGHSRGAIACNYIGLHDDEIAKLWRAMIPVSHYDDAHTLWGMTSEEKARAPQRLRRLGTIPQFICGEHHLPQNHQTAKLQDIVKQGQFDNFAAAKKKLGLVPILEAEGTRKFIATNYPQARCTFVDLPYVNHTTGYVLRDIPERKQLRAWLQEVLRDAPGKNGNSKIESNK